MPPAPPFRLDELGCLQFERFCAELLAVGDGAAYETRPWGASLLLREGVAVPGGGPLPGPTLVLIAWLRHGSSAPGAPRRLRHLVEDALGEWTNASVRSLLLLTNVPGREALPGGLAAAALGPAELWRLLADRPRLRYLVPSALGAADVGALVPADVRGRSTGDVDAAVGLARVFVPTRAYHDTLRVLEGHGFAVLTGPPEMGKTAIARMLGLASLTDGWELHECIRPDELWSRFARDRRQLFVADDAFGSTEYRPEAAERWAVELDRVLRSLDDRHRLIWTSRPAPLRAALRRIHREHGVERFPRAAEITVDAAALGLTEKALILFRHSRAAAPTEDAIRLVQRHGFAIVSHPHFTPERIRRFVVDRLPELAARHDADRVAAAAVAAEIREPTAAMSASYRALAPEHRAVLVALLDTSPGPVAERELAAAARRHGAGGLGAPPGELVDRLADHFLRVVERAGVTWVHPSWRDLVIEELAADRRQRRAFLGACSVHGGLLALSTAGGAAGERTLPLLREDGDWDALADRLAALAPELDAPEVTLLLGALAEALERAPGAARAEAAALARETLARLGRAWEAARLAVPVGLLDAWLGLWAALPERPPAPAAALAATWVELVPVTPPDLSSRAELAVLEDWLALAELLQRSAPDALLRFGFPSAQADLLADLVEAAHRIAFAGGDAADGELLARALRRIARLAPVLAAEAERAAVRLAAPREPAPDPRPPLRELSPEIARLLELPFARAGRDEDVVARVLRDL